MAAGAIWHVLCSQSGGAAASVPLAGARCPARPRAAPLPRFKTLLQTTAADVDGWTSVPHSFNASCILFAGRSAACLHSNTECEDCVTQTTRRATQQSRRASCTPTRSTCCFLTCSAGARGWHAQSPRNRRRRHRPDLRLQPRQQSRQHPPTQAPPPEEGQKSQQGTAPRRRRPGGAGMRRPRVGRRRRGRRGSSWSCSGWSRGSGIIWRCCWTPPC